MIKKVIIVVMVSIVFFMVFTAYAQENRKDGREHLFLSINDIEIDNDSNIYIPTNIGKNINVYNDDGDFQYSFKTLGLGSLAFDIKNNEISIAFSKRNVVRVFDEDCNLIDEHDDDLGRYYNKFIINSRHETGESEVFSVNKLFGFFTISKIKEEVNCIITTPLALWIIIKVLIAVMILVTTAIVILNSKLVNIKGKKKGLNKKQMSLKNYIKMNFRVKNHDTLMKDYKEDYGVILNQITLVLDVLILSISTIRILSFLSKSFHQSEWIKYGVIFVVYSFLMIIFLNILALWIRYNFSDFDTQ